MQFSSEKTQAYGLEIQKFVRNLGRDPIGIFRGPRLLRYPHIPHRPCVPVSRAVMGFFLARKVYSDRLIALGEYEVPEPQDAHNVFLALMR